MNEKNVPCESCFQPLSEDQAEYVKCFSKPGTKLRLCHSCAKEINSIGDGTIGHERSFNWKIRTCPEKSI